MKKKVFLLIGTLSSGGAERVVSNLSLNLSNDIETVILLFGEDAKIEYSYKGEIYYLDKLKTTNIFCKLYAFLKRVYILKRIKKKNPNVPFISFLEYPNLLNILSGEPKRTILSVRNFMSKKHKQGLKSAFWNFTIKRLYKRAKSIIVVSQLIKDDLINNYKIPMEKIHLIYNSYPLEKIKNLSNEKLSNNEEKIFKNPVIITAGRLKKQKGHYHLLKAFSIVKKSIPNAQLVILGEGELEGKLKTISKELNVDDSVHFLGFQKNPFKYIARSKVFVMTSYYEGFPNALAEAMACKVPVISTDCPSGPREILVKGGISNPIKYGFNNQNYGILVPPFNSDNHSEVENLIASSIQKIVKNNEYYDFFSEMAYKRILDFDIREIIKEWEKIIIEK